ncbi:MAG: pantetheine-phosphate adenylyltransferase [Candidatus Thermoplasmatota archaeon]|jgi:pantetheine-phosphate adenylyltransferase|nr:pantetheine-phosphate adenylyltransferase [Candidatus Thermoplasmatota archaeon]MCL5793228.1 pantetheine-phosphate adenylyltransferase [Candidatus Thermoplasmatota archaeon]
MSTVVGGTFAILHDGHRKLLEAAVGTGDHVIVGLTTDQYLEKYKIYDRIRYEKRLSALREFMSSITDNYEVKPLDSTFGSSAVSAEYRTIVVSPETYPTALKINEERGERGLNELRIIRVPYVIAEDLFPVSSTRIIDGQIDAHGHRLREIAVYVCTDNRLKVSAVEEFLSGIFSNVKIQSDGCDGLPGDQPFGFETFEWASMRSRRHGGDFDYSIGIESGLFMDPASDRYLDFHVCSVRDRFGKITVGASSGFQVPDSIVETVKNGMNMSEAFGRLYGESGIGGKEGIVGKITKNRLTRRDLISESVRNAFMPRLNPEYY